MTCWTQFIFQQSPKPIYFKQGLKSELEKSSPSLGRSAIYVKDSRINALPRYQTNVIVEMYYSTYSISIWSYRLEAIWFLS